MIQHLTLQTNIPHRPADAYRFRGRVNTHVMITFLTQLRMRHPRLFEDVKAIEVLDILFEKNKMKHSKYKTELITDIIALLYRTYPELVYFHNHHPDGHTDKNYPLIHYQSKRGKAVIQVLNEAIPIVEKWWSKAPLESWFSILNIVDKKEQFDKIKLAPDLVYYRLMDWVALNEDNYAAWQQQVLMRDRLDIMEQALTGQLRHITETFAPHIDKSSISAQIVLIRNMRTQKTFHGDNLAFNVLFRANVDIPDALAIGNAISIGFGSQQKTKWQGTTATNIVSSKQVIHQK